jgi:hypothetical protein
MYSYIAKFKNKKPTIFQTTLPMQVRKKVERDGNGLTLR